MKKFFRFCNKEMGGCGKRFNPDTRLQKLCKKCKVRCFHKRYLRMKSTYSKDAKRINNQSLRSMVNQYKSRTKQEGATLCLGDLLH